MLHFARVVNWNSESNSVDVVLMQDNRRFSGVQILSKKAGGDFGHYGLGVPTETGYDAKTTRKRDVFCVVAFVGTNPVVMGFLFPQVTQMLFSKDADPRYHEMEVDRHPSDLYSIIDGDGNFEMRHPSGAFIRVAVDPSHEDLSSKDYLERWKIEKNTDKKVHIHVQQADGKAWVDIDPDGNIVVNGPVLLCQTPKMIVEGNVTIDGTLHVTGNIGSEGDVIAGDGEISLLNHKHENVRIGIEQSGGPIVGGSMPPADDFTPDGHLPADG